MATKIIKVDIPELMTTIRALSIQTFHEAYENDNTKENMLAYTNKHFSENQLLSEFSKPGHFFYIIYFESEAAGYFKLRTEEILPDFKDLQQIELERIYILKKFQKQKLGFACMKFCIEESASMGYDVLWLGVWMQNEKAIRFYKKIGFEIFGEHTFVLGDDPQKDYLMKLYIKDFKFSFLIN